MHDCSPCHTLNHAGLAAGDLFGPRLLILQIHLESHCYTMLVLLLYAFFQVTSQALAVLQLLR